METLEIVYIVYIYIYRLFSGKLGRLAYVYNKITEVCRRGLLFPYDVYEYKAYAAGAEDDPRRSEETPSHILLLLVIVIIYYCQYALLKQSSLLLYIRFIIFNIILTFVTYLGGPHNIAEASSRVCRNPQLGT